MLWLVRASEGEKKQHSISICVCPSIWSCLDFTLFKRQRNLHLSGINTTQKAMMMIDWMVWTPLYTQINNGPSPSRSSTVTGKKKKVNPTKYPHHKKTLLITVKDEYLSLLLGWYLQNYQLAELVFATDWVLNRLAKHLSDKKHFRLELTWNAYDVGQVYDSYKP